MLNAIAPRLGDERVSDLKGKLAIQTEQTRPAEWEVVVAFSLSQVGKITDFGNKKKGNPDFIWDVDDHSMLVEVTAVSDTSFHETNPVDDFGNELRRIFKRNGILNNGRYVYDFGDIEQGNKIILGIPERKHFAMFFSSPEFIQFVNAIKRAPGESHHFEFSARGSNSHLSYFPDKGYASGGYRNYTVPQHIRHSPIFNSLAAKEAQIKRSGSELPAILVMCDNDCDALRRRDGNTNGRIGMEDIVRVFLNGQQGLKLGDLVLEKRIPAQGRRIHAVIWISVRDQLNIMDIRRNEVKLDVGMQIANYAAPYIKSNDFLNTLNQAFNRLPAPVRTARVANTMVRKYPRFFGRFSMSDNKVRFSALTLQKLLIGEITFAEFEEHHKELVNVLKSSNALGLTLNNARIEISQDEDDDWVEFEFGNVNLSCYS